MASNSLDSMEVRALPVTGWQRLSVSTYLFPSFISATLLMLTSNTDLFLVSHVYHNYFRTFGLCNSHSAYEKTLRLSSLSFTYPSGTLCSWYRQNSCFLPFYNTLCNPSTLSPVILWGHKSVLERMELNFTECAVFSDHVYFGNKVL